MELDTDIKENSQEKINHNSKNVMKFIKSLIFFKSHKWRHSMKSSFLNSINPALGKDLSCFFNWAFGFAQSAAKGFAIKLSLALLLALVKRKSLLKTIIGTFSKDSLSFSMYCGLLVGLYKLTICSLRAIGKTDDKVNSIIAGLVCSLSALADRSNERRQTLILYLLARTLETSVNYSNNHDIIKITRHIYVLLYPFRLYNFFYFAIKQQKK